jgi:hypothetical protein
MRYQETASDFVSTIPKMKPTMMYFKNFITVIFMLLKKCLKIVFLAPTGGKILPIFIGRFGRMAGTRMLKKPERCAPKKSKAIKNVP